MPGNDTFCYQTARKTACLTQEQAAERLALSLESVKAYERGERIPPNAVARRMAEAYGTPWLVLEHLRQSSAELGVLPPDLQLQPLPTAVLQLVNRVFAFAHRHRDRQLMRIAEDGVVDALEQAEYDAIVRDLDGIICAAYQVMFPLPPGIKRNRPGLAPEAVRFKGLRRKNNCKIHYSTSLCKIKKKFSPKQGGIL